jgi:hypothetical protein
MAARGWRRVRWAILAVAFAGLVAYMLSVGWDQASLVAVVGGFFVAVAGLTLALAERRSTAQNERGQIKQQMRDVVGNAVLQEAQVSPAEDVTQSMEGVTARNAPARQRIRGSTRPPAGAVEAGGERDA